MIRSIWEDFAELFIHLKARDMQVGSKFIKAAKSSKVSILKEKNELQDEHFVNNQTHEDAVDKACQPTRHQTFSKC